MNGLLSVIIPAYNEQEMIPKAAGTIAEILEQAEISYELLFVNDGSRDEFFEKFRQRIGDFCRVIRSSGRLCGCD